MHQPAISLGCAGVRYSRSVTISVLSPEILQGIRDRAAGTDQRNEFCHTDLRVLAAAGYLHGHLTLTDAVADQRLLARHAPATALAVGMHHIWVGVARQLIAAGVSAGTILDDARAGEVLAFGISEAGNDAVLGDSSTVARTHPDGAATLTGTKIFTSMSPVWTRLGTFGIDGDELVFGFVARERDADGVPVNPTGVTQVADWDTLGMRATQSWTTHLADARIEPQHVLARTPRTQSDPLRYAIFGVFSTMVASVYLGLAERALELAVDAARTRTSRLAGGSAYSDDPDIRRQLAEAALIVDGLVPQVESMAAALDREAADGRIGSLSFRQFAGLKHRAVESARSVVDIALRVAGGNGYRNGSEISRLQRDVLAGIYHPSDPESVRRTVASDLLD